jgi:hypothetical protein
LIPVATHDQIRLALPADAEYGRIARIAAAGLALRLGFSYSEIEDLRLAVDETVILLLRQESDDGTLTILFDPTPERITIDAHGPAGSRSADGSAESFERFSSIVADVVDRYEVDENCTHVRLVKDHRAVD